MAADRFRDSMNQVLARMHRKYAAEVNLYGDVIRAVVALNSSDYGIVNIGSAWLQGQDIDAEGRRLLGTIKSQERNVNIVRGLSWLMSLHGPAVLALDQLDPIVTQLKLQTSDIEATSALTIINKLGAGLSELRDVVRRTLTIVSCVETTWRSISEYTPKQFTDRYHGPRRLGPLNSQKSISGLLIERLRPAFQQADFTPPYATWPFSDSWLQQVTLDSPREILKKCQSHIDECVRRGEARELPPGWSGTISEPNPNHEYAKLDRQLEELRRTAKIEEIVDEQHEDDRLGAIIRSAVRCVVKETKLPESVDPSVDESFTGTTKPLHVRLRLVFPKENAREEHFCLRALQKANSRAFTARLRSAITMSGIDKTLKFRRLVIVRKGLLPGGQETERLTKQFNDLGGRWLEPIDDDLTILEALRQMEKEAHPNFNDWLADRKAASQTKFMRKQFPDFLRLPNLYYRELMASKRTRTLSHLKRRRKSRRL